MGARELERRVEAVRRFNRFYTRPIGVRRRGAYDSPFSLTEVRVLYELAHREQPTATELGRDLGLDAGYLSRMLRGFEKRALVAKTRSAADGRRSHLALTGLGRKVFAPLNTRSRSEEHTSELQSPCNLVCRLLLEKKKHIIHTALHSHCGPYYAGALGALSVRRAKLTPNRANTAVGPSLRSAGP